MTAALPFATPAPLGDEVAERPARSTFPPAPTPPSWLRGDTVHRRYAALAAASTGASASSATTAERSLALVERVKLLRERARRAERLLLEDVTHPAFLGDRERCLAVNTAFLALFGCSRESVEGVPWAELLWPPGLAVEWPADGVTSLTFRAVHGVMRGHHWWVTPPGPDGVFRAVCERDSSVAPPPVVASAR